MARITLLQRKDEITRTLTLLEQKIVHDKARVTMLEGKIEPGILDQGQTAIRKSLVTTRNRLKRLRGKALFLRQNLESLPLMLEKLAEKMDHLRRRHNAEIEVLDAAMDSQFSAGLASLRDDFLDVAGASREGKARLIHSLSRTGHNE
jgi:uncharacterized protein YaaN involved in tellurite resistance